MSTSFVETSFQSRQRRSVQAIRCILPRTMARALRPQEAGLPEHERTIARDIRPLLDVWVQNKDTRYCPGASVYFCVAKLLKWVTLIQLFWCGVSAVFVLSRLVLLEVQSLWRNVARLGAPYAFAPLGPSCYATLYNSNFSHFWQCSITIRYWTLILCKTMSIFIFQNNFQICLYMRCFACARRGKVSQALPRIPWVWIAPLPRHSVCL